MAAKDYDIESDLTIDRFHLDDELIRQPSLIFRYGTLLANAREEVESAKLHLEITVARLDKEIRRAAVAVGKKVTEGSIEAAIHQEEEYRDAQLNLIDASKTCNILQTAVSAFNHKRDSLNGLLTLSRMEYWADVEKNPEAHQKNAEATRSIAASRIANRRNRGEGD